MRIGGIIEHDKNSSVPYYISIPERTLKEAHKMILDAFGELLSEHTKGEAIKKDIEIIPYGKTQFDVVIKKKVKEVTAFIIHRLRAFSDMTQADVVKKWENLQDVPSLFMKTRLVMLLLQNFKKLFWLLDMI